MRFDQRKPVCAALVLVGLVLCATATTKASLAKAERVDPLAEALSAAVTTLVADGRYATLYERWFGQRPGTPRHPFPNCTKVAFPEPTGQLATVLRARRLRLGYALMGPPFSTETEQGPVGWDLELGTLLAEVLGEHYGVELAADHVLLPGSPFPAALFAALNEGSCDAVLSDLAITAERRRQVDFSCPYLSVTFGLLSRCSTPMARLSGPAAANRPEIRLVVLRHAFLNELADRFLGSATHIFVEDPRDIPRELLRERADAALLPASSIRAYLEEHPELCASPFPIGPGAERGIALRKSPPGPH